MLKKLFLAGAAALILAGATVTLAPAPVQAGHSGCLKAAKAKYPGDWKVRQAYRKECKAQYKVYSTAHKTHHWFKKTV
jgi:predicted metal-dependent phosphoesterase TrpH